MVDNNTDMNSGNDRGTDENHLGFSGWNWNAQQQSTLATYAVMMNMDPAKVVQMMADTMVHTMEKTIRKKDGETMDSETKTVGPTESCPGAVQAPSDPLRDIRPNEADERNMGTIVLIDLETGKEVHSANAITHPEPSGPREETKEDEPAKDCLHITSEQSSMTNNGAGKTGSRTEACHPNPATHPEPTGQGKKTSGGASARAPLRPTNEQCSVTENKAAGGRGGVEAHLPDATTHPMPPGQGMRTDEGGTEESLPPAKGESGPVTTYVLESQESSERPTALVTGARREDGAMGAPLTRSFPATLMGQHAAQRLGWVTLHSRYAFINGAPLKGYLRNKMFHLKEHNTLYEVLTMLKLIISKEELFDAENVTRIRPDAALRDALQCGEIGVTEIREVVLRQMVRVGGCYPMPPFRNGGVAAEAATRIPAVHVAGALVPLPPGLNFPRARNAGAPEAARALPEAPGPPAPTTRTDAPIAQRPFTRSVSTRHAQDTGAMGIGTPSRKRSGGTDGRGSTASGRPPEPKRDNGGPRSRAGQYRTRGRMHLDSEAQAQVRGVIATLTLLLAQVGPADGFRAYDCATQVGPVKMFSLVDVEPCWINSVKPLEETAWEGRVLVKRREVRIPVTRCDLAETVLQSDCSKGKDKPNLVRIMRYRKPMEVNRSSCEEALKMGRIRVEGHKLHKPVTYGKPAIFERQYDKGLDGNKRCIPKETGQQEGFLTQTLQIFTVKRVWGSWRPWEDTVMTEGENYQYALAEGRTGLDRGVLLWNQEDEACHAGLEVRYKGILNVSFSNIGEEPFLGGVATLPTSWEEGGLQLELTKKETLCGMDVWKTQLEDVYLQLGSYEEDPDWGKPTLEASREDSIMELKLLWGAQRGRSMTERMKELRRREEGHGWTPGLLGAARYHSAAGQESARGVQAALGEGHLVVRSGAALYVAECQTVEVRHRKSEVCTQEIPIYYRGRKAFVDPFSKIIQTMGSPSPCSRIAPPRWKVGEYWYCGYPEFKPCGNPLQIPLGGRERKTSPSGNSTRSEEDWAEFTKLQELTAGRYAFQVKAAHAAKERGSSGSWGLGMSRAAEVLAADMVGERLLPWYNILKPVLSVTFLAMGAAGALSLVSGVIIRTVILWRIQGGGLWVLGVLWDTVFQVAISPIKWAMDNGREEALVVLKRTGCHPDIATSRLEAEANADGNNEPAPRSRESASGGSRPLSGEDRELLH